MSLITVDHRKCKRCGMCVAVCPVCTIGFSDSGPCELHGENCISCGHCTAVCPNDAFDNAKVPRAAQLPADPKHMPGAANVEYLLRSRRSCRNFTPEKVSRELIIEILDTARHAPTAGNTGGIEFLVIDNSERLTQITLAAINGIDGFLYNSSPLPDMLAAMIGQYRKDGVDTVLRGAPCLVLALADKNLLPVFRENGRFMICYAELYAHSLGLACCRTGLVEICALSGCKPLLDLLEIPTGKVLCGAFVLGYPRHEYQRLADRGPTAVTFVE